MSRRFSSETVAMTPGPDFDPPVMALDALNTRGVVTVRHSLTPAQAALVKADLERHWPDCEVRVVRVGWRLWPLQRRLGVRVRWSW